MQIDVSEGQSKNFLLFPSEFELVIIDDFSNAEKDIISSYSLKELKRGFEYNGVSFKLITHYENAIINQRGIESLKYDQLGQYYKLISLPKTYKMDERNVPGVELQLSLDGGKNNMIFWGGSAIYQSFIIGDNSYLIKLRPKRLYLPFAIYLKKILLKQITKEQILQKDLFLKLI